jgi:hypothetical protein
MDHTLLDLFYANRLLKVGGIVLIDDVLTKSVNKAVRYFLNYPNFKVIARAKSPNSFKRRMYYTLFELLGMAVSIIPKKNMIFQNEVLFSDRRLKIDASMIAFKKISHDHRTWNWYKPF